MDFDWTAEVAGRMHAAGITGLELAKEAGVSNSYLSAVLHKKRGYECTQKRIIEALERLEQQKQSQSAKGDQAHGDKQQPH